MRAFHHALLFLSVALSAVAAPRNLRSTRRQEPAAASAQSLAQPCHHVMAYAEQGAMVFLASEVFECLKNVPFNPAVATRFLDHYNHTMQYQSTLGLLANPPEGYQRPAVNFQQGLADIRENITAGRYTSQYAFEAELHILINLIYDVHVTLDAGIMAAFDFASPYGIVSASIDGKKEPEIYFIDDIIRSRFEGWKPYPITHINGQNAVDFLLEFSNLNSKGYLEPHADWNALMENPAADVLGDINGFQNAMFYPGDELNFSLANNTKVEAWWWAIYRYQGRTGPLSTAGDFFNYFVLGLPPAGFDPENLTNWWPEENNFGADDTSSNPSATAGDWGCSSETPMPNWCHESFGAYPKNPAVAQADLNITGDGSVTGYFFDDIFTGVLSIPTFFQLGESVDNFYMAVDDFITNATKHNTKRVIIDLQRNSGGDVLLALTTFSQFFPQIAPYTGSRIRTHEYANTLGQAWTQWWKNLEPGPLRDVFADSEWIIANHINAATGVNFSSWTEYSGPSDAFSRTQLFNLSDTTSDEATFGWAPSIYTAPNTTPSRQLWQPSDIVLLTDGLCSSACTLFVELMSHQAGVRTVVAGGTPKSGPMQTAAGNRGAAIYSASSLQLDYKWLNTTVEDSAAYARLPSASVWNETGMWVQYETFNLRDQMRPNDTVPLQFKYDAAQCRIYYTLDSVYNMTNLWRNAAAATWMDSSLCVRDSTGYATPPAASSSTAAKPPPKPNTTTLQPPTPHLSLSIPFDSDNSTTAGFELLAGGPGLAEPKSCRDGGDCDGDERCEPLPVWCDSGVKARSEHKFCVQRCTTVASSCKCIPKERMDNIRANVPKTSKNKMETNLVGYKGYCPAGKIDAVRYGITCPV